MLTIHAAVRGAIARGEILFVAHAYAEPGYRKDGERDILFANWNPEPLARPAQLAERAGYTVD